MADYASSLIQALRGSTAAQAPQSAVPGYELFSPQYQQSTSRMVPRDYSGMAFNPQVQTHQAAPAQATANKTIELLRNFPVLSHPQYTGGDGGGYAGMNGGSGSAAGIGNMASLSGMLSDMGLTSLGNRAAMATAGMLQGMETADINGYGGYGFEGGGGYGTGVGPGGSGTGPGGYGPQ